MEAENGNKQLIPLHHLSGIVCIGNIIVSPPLMMKCADEGRSITFLETNGAFKARVEGPVSGNVLLRQAQYQMLGQKEKQVELVRAMIAGKIQNMRSLLMRAARETSHEDDETVLRKAANALAIALKHLQMADDINQIRGIEGESSKNYFQAFSAMIRVQRDSFQMNGRNRRPPLDPINAVLSFLYTLLMHDCKGAIESVGLDPQVGFLHTLRPGRQSLALDIMEELRSIFADRLALTLINRQQIGPNDFESRPGGAIYLNEKGKKEVVIAYQKRKQDELLHPVLNRKVAFGLIPFVQARLLARYMRGDADSYIPYLYK
ncbi:CRISPR-associated protein Cas1 [Heliophilum fasciatum]|nr:CRISPR-associated protein Cas1 [Heliophilum fasciatum]